MIGICEEAILDGICPFPFAPGFELFCERITNCVSGLSAKQAFWINLPLNIFPHALLQLSPGKGY